MKYFAGNGCDDHAEEEEGGTQGDVEWRKVHTDGLHHMHIHWKVESCS